MSMNPKLVDRRIVLRYEEGQHAFRHISPTASYSQLFDLAAAINRFQQDEAQQVLLVTVQQFV